MGKDIPEKRLEDWDDVFTDIFDNLLFGGEKVLEGKELIPMPTESYMRKTDGTQREGARDVHKAIPGVKSGIVDIQKADRHGSRYRLICGLENQTGVDNTMPERVMMYDCADYEEQIRKIMDRNRKKKNEAVTKRIHSDQKLAPVITLVLYYGKDEWVTPKSLHDMLEFPEGMEDSIKPYVADYPINLIQVARLTEEERGKLNSDFRLIAEYIARGNDKEKLNRFFRENRQVIRHEEEFIDVMNALTGKQSGREMLKTIKEKKREETGGIRVIDLFEMYENEGIKKGVRRGMRKGVRKGVKKGLEKGRWEGIRAVICDNRDNHVSKEMILQKLVRLFEISREEAEKYYDRAVQKEAKNCYNQVNEKD